MYVDSCPEICKTRDMQQQLQGALPSSSPVCQSHGSAAEVEAVPCFVNFCCCLRLGKHTCLIHVCRASLELHANISLFLPLSAHTLTHTHTLPLATTNKHTHTFTHTHIHTHTTSHLFILLLTDMGCALIKRQ